MTRPLTIDLPDAVAQGAEDAARAAGESVEAFVARTVAFEVERGRTESFFAERRARADIALALAILDRDGGEPPQPGDELPERYARAP